MYVCMYDFFFDFISEMCAADGIEAKIPACDSVAVIA